VYAVATLPLPDNRLIAITGSWDQTVRVWDLHTDDCVYVLPFPGSIASVATAIVDDRPSVVAVGHGIAAFRL
jgi:WD40 repeat protein